MYHDEMTASAASDHGLAQGPPRASPSPTRGSSTTSSPALAAWEAGCGRSTPASRRLAARQRHARPRAPRRCSRRCRRSDALGQLAYRVYYYAALNYDQDQRDNAANGRRQRVQHLLAQWRQATSWFNPELLAMPLATRAGWMEASAGARGLSLRHRGSLPAAGARARRGGRAAAVAVGAVRQHARRQLRSARRPPTRSSRPSRSRPAKRSRPPTPATAPSSPPTASRRIAPRRSRRTTSRSPITRTPTPRSTTACCSATGSTPRPAATRRCSRPRSHGNAIPTSVVENLIATAAPASSRCSRYERLRKRVLGLDELSPLRRHHPARRVRSRAMPYHDVLDWIVESVALLGADYQARMRRAFAERWIDVYENPGKHSGAYSAAVYGVHPYMLLNWNDTLDSVFTLAHEMGHSMHTMLAHETQPFVYSSYTIFVAEVPSTLSEALLLDYMLARADRSARARGAAAARHRRGHQHVLPAGAVRQLRARGAPAGRARRADHRRHPEHAVSPAC